ncbi:MAG TPA: phenylalanine--tRNA ligase subunit beta [Blastocatellia bacterium]|nr:phenylalanine--tRNA ligase subunit beta [Blastocatellia bacterium]HMV84929.1 phenylalanine--tRNA ligase subunit beta [Blastocatellia bacterium]HMY75554.1 phenylalanine--tRNA ligase subunit beta [Blastocatellia bacterium]HMZ16900.1 phenylalanine--tRNA ligase subunit beta [Blastocatellia bacterium]
MKISYNWLKEFVDVDLAPRDLAEKLTMVGLAVDGVEEHGEDFVLDIDLTSNRPDCLSHLGVAREVAAITRQSLRMPAAETGRRGDGETGRQGTNDVTSVQILSPELCPRYSARIIKGVKIGPSPDWLVKRLEVMGQRSVNNVADITNYVMLELGQPLHAFDLAMLKEQRIIVRAARDGERMTTLDGEERELTSQMLVIADAERAVALGGIKGGEDSGITDATVDVLLEAAYFTPAQIRATSKALGLSTEASYRFERGTDPEVVPVASARAAAMIAEIAGGEVLDGIEDVYPKRAERRKLSMRRARYSQLTGLQIELGEAEAILRGLGFEVEADVENDALHTAAPSWRIDIAIEEDLIEEVARIAGYDNLKTTLPGSAGAGAYLPGEEGRRAARRALTAVGYNEAVSFSFVNAEADAIVSNAPDSARLLLQNPIDETQSHMRTTLLGGLLKALEHNFNHASRNVRMFEIGKCFFDEGEERPRETEHLALVATGARNEFDWQAANARLDFFDVKGAVESIATAMGLPPLDFTAVETIASLHPGRAALISVAGKRVGQIGQLHPRVAAGYKFKQAVFVAELDFGAMLDADRAGVRYQPLPKYPTVVRDLALLIDTGVPLAAIERAVYELNLPELVGFRLFDLYSGKELPAGKHSLALSLRYRAADRTLTDEEISAMHARIVTRLVEEFSAEVR